MKICVGFNEHKMSIRKTTRRTTSYFVYYIYIYIHIYIFFFFAVALRPNAGHGLLILEASRSHTTMQHSRQDSSGRVISSSQRPLPDNTQHSQQTNTHAPGWIRTHDLSRRAAADPRLRPRGHWYIYIYIYIFCIVRAWVPESHPRSMYMNYNRLVSNLTNDHWQ